MVDGCLFIDNNDNKLHAIFFPTTTKIVSTKQMYVMYVLLSSLFVYVLCFYIKHYSFVSSLMRFVLYFTVVQPCLCVVTAVVIVNIV